MQRVRLFLSVVGRFDDPDDSVVTETKNSDRVSLVPAAGVPDHRRGQWRAYYLRLLHVQDRPLDPAAELSAGAASGCRHRRFSQHFNCRYVNPGKDSPS